MFLFRCEFLNILALSVLEREELMQEECQRLYVSQFNRSKSQLC